ncbi:MAG TPA: biotin/lipoyl-containing protein, partial [Acidimicrobiales bacterium]|nr:biotin/lipoyl-containing protein [Acidimicrobiales bacterium]
WVGWGFVAEKPEFAELCESLGVVFVGPRAEVMRRLGDKIGAKLLAEEAGVPVAAWSGGAVESLDEARKHAEDIGYPLMVKASAGGGGRGIRMVREAGELENALERASAEAASSFGDPRVFMERVVEGARHIEVQVIADMVGNVWAPGVRDCSLQRRNQKVVEESASPALDREHEEMAREAAVRLVKLAGYTNAGTVEFLYEPTSKALAFLEVNTRLQVEHTVTEQTTGLDLVRLQLDVASGKPLEGQCPAVRGHAIEVRLNAEDPAAGFSPAPGRISYLAWPTGPHVRVDTGVALGDVVAPEYDSMIAKIVGWGRDRDEALVRLQRALAETFVMIRGGTTNKAFLLDLIARPEAMDGTADTGFLDRAIASGEYVFPDRGSLALVAAAIECYKATAADEKHAFFVAAARGRPLMSHGVGQQVELGLGGASYKLDVRRAGPSRFVVVVDDRLIDVSVEAIDETESFLTIAGSRHRVLSQAEDSGFMVEVDGVAHRVSFDDAGLLRAQSPGVVVSVAVSPGDQVEQGSRVLVLESMKMEVAITSPVSGRVAEIFVAANGQVNAGAPLIRLQAADAADPGTLSAVRVDFGGLAAAGDRADTDAAAGGEDDLWHIVDSLRSLILGFDYSAAQASELVRNFAGLRTSVAPNDPEAVLAGIGILEAFADLCQITRNRRVDGGDEGEEAHNPREFFHAYLQTLDTDRAGLPPSFEVKLRRLLAHYGIDSLER